MKQLALVSSALLLAFGLIVGVIFIKTSQPVAIMSEAQEDKPLRCPISTSIYVHEIDKNGREIPLSLDNYSELDALQWSIEESSNPSKPIYFNVIPQFEFGYDTEILTLNPQSTYSSIHKKGDVISLTLNYQPELFSIVKQEIATCSSPSQGNLCSTNINKDQATTPTTNLDTISDITLDCNMTLNVGWVVQKHDVAPDLTAQSSTVSSFTCDINGDSACNTFDLFIVLDQYGKEGTALSGDINKDGKVNALDYTLMTSKISLL